MGLAANFSSISFALALVRVFFTRITTPRDEVLRVFSVPFLPIPLTPLRPYLPPLGTAIRHPNGQVILDPDPWSA